MMLNATLAAAGNPVPQLCYGRYNGKYVFISGGMLEIPEASILLDMSDHNSPDSKFGYHIWLHNNSGTLTLTATDDAIDDTDGIKHKTSASSYRYLGDVYPVAIHTGHYGPVFCQDRRLVWNQFNREKVSLGKYCPYAANSSITLPKNTTTWTNFSDSYDVDVLGGGDVVELELTTIFSTSGYLYVALAPKNQISLDPVNWPRGNTNARSRVHNNGNTHQKFKMNILGHSTISIYFMNTHATTDYACYLMFYDGTPYYDRTDLQGSCWC
jgi:hypothetical protein